MKIIKIILFVMLITVCFSCQKDTEEESFDNTINSEVSARPYYNGRQTIIYWVSGSSYGLYLDGMRIDTLCLGIGRCYLALATLDSLMGGTPLLVSIDNNNPNKLHVKLLNEHITLNEVESAYEDNDFGFSMQEIHEALKRNIGFEEPIVLSNEISNAILENSENKITILQGEYHIDYSNSEFGEFDLDIVVN